MLEISVSLEKKNFSGGAATGNRESEEGVGSVSVGSGEEERVGGEEGDRNWAGNRWPRQETLALLRIRSDMDDAFKESSTKAPLWEEVSRKLGELGYNRGAKKCKEKFENIYKYHRRTKEVRSSRPNGKTYRFFEQLEALDSHTPEKAEASLLQTAMVGRRMEPTNVIHNAIPHSVIQNPDGNFVENSTPTTSSSSKELDGMRKKKRKLGEYFEGLMKEVMEKQENLQRKFIEALEKCEQDRMAREEVWKMQELDRIKRERELLAQERSITAAKDAAVLAFLKKFSEQSSSMQLPEEAIMFAMPVEKVVDRQENGNGGDVMGMQDKQNGNVLNRQEDNSGGNNLENQENYNYGNSIQMSSARWPKDEVDALQHVSALNFGDPFRKHEMRCRFKQKPPWPWLAITTSIGILVIALLVGYIFHATVNRIAKVEDDCQKMTELKKQAEAADVAKSQFLATVSHEIRTPMNGVLGMLDMLMDTDLDVTQQDYVRTAQDSGKALVSLINEVLDQAKIESGRLELEAVQFDPRAILDDVLSLFSGKTPGNGVELAVYISDRVPEMLIGDAGRFRQIITNLMGNSIKFTEKGHIFVTVHLVEEVIGSIEVETESPSKSTLSGFPVADRKRSWEGFRTFSQEGSTCTLSSPSSDLINLIVSVEDTGVGIPIEAQSRVFTPFMQVGPSISRTHGGTGIGLSISKCLVGLMKGEIGFVSIPKIGSTFTFTAVFTNGSSHPNEYKSLPINNQSKSTSSEFQGMTALVVDPRPVRAMVSRYHIQRLGIRVEVVPDLNQGFANISSGNTAFNMVLVEQDVWDRESVKKSDSRMPPKLFLLANPIGSSRISDATPGDYTPPVIMKPLRASMLSASLQRAMGVGNKGNPRNGELPGFSLRNLLLGRKILIVDDNLVNLRVAAGALKKYGADVVCADSGKKAISLLKPPHHFDACFMDIQMPDIDGFEATRRIRDMEHSFNNLIQHGEVSVEAPQNISNWHVPILAMTADVIQATHEQSLKCGMDGYVSKPFEAQQLYREVSLFFQSASNGNI